MPRCVFAILGSLDHVNFFLSKLPRVHNLLQLHLPEPIRVLNDEDMAES
jgi:hypothetical protein